MEIYYQELESLGAWLNYIIPRILVLDYCYNAYYDISWIGMESCNKPGLCHRSVT
jgi:hypothetical protein